MDQPNIKKDIALRFKKIRNYFYNDKHGGIKICAERVGFPQSVWSDFEWWLIRGDGDIVSELAGGLRSRNQSRMREEVG